MNAWQLQEAKNRLSELVRRALDEGPQMITVRGEETAVVVSADEYRRLAGRPRQTLVEFLMSSPLAGEELRIDRPKDYGRAIEL